MDVGKPGCSSTTGSVWTGYWTSSRDATIPGLLYAKLLAVLQVGLVQQVHTGTKCPAERNNKTVDS